MWYSAKVVYTQLYPMWLCFLCLKSGNVSKTKISHRCSIGYCINSNEPRVKSDRISHILKRCQWTYIFESTSSLFYYHDFGDSTSELCSSAWWGLGWWTLAFQTHIRGAQYAFFLILVPGYYSCSTVDPQSKFTSKSFWSEQLLAAMVNSRFCVSAGVLMLAGRCSLAS